MNDEPNLKLASCALPPIAEEIRRKIGNTAFRIFLSYLEDEYNLTPNPWDVVRLAKEQLGYNGELRPYQIVMWRQVLTFNSRKLIPELASLKAVSPLVCVYPVIEEAKDSAA